MDVEVKCIGCGRRLGVFRLSKHEPQQTIEVNACCHAKEVAKLPALEPWCGKVDCAAGQRP